ncbi:MAG: pyridoxal 5'-phosphate synthase glutaminase subunit PdxT [Desulfovibrio sp.]|jgi:5'-phosphate synthase pdxT subunit|nr:pyridoxal 5'-phosphate synthase glutaminase subunit PdxT [Desulfovibrio sp.]
MAKNIGLLALQGAFREHGNAMRALGCDVSELRQKKHLAGIDAMIIPGGESTAIGKLLVDLDMLDTVREMIREGLPVYGSCAGLILLCKTIIGSEQPRLGLLDAAVRRNAFGRQVDSFECNLPVPVLGDAPFPAVFIRAPLIESAGPEVDVLAEVEMGGQNKPVAVRQGNILATSFHPELTDDMRFHRYFLDMI